MSRLENDCLAILSYVAAHRKEHQTFRSLSKGMNIPLKTLYRILTWHKKYGKNNSTLFRIAFKYGYDLEIFDDKEGKIIWVDYLGVDNFAGRWGQDWEENAGKR